MRSLRLDQYSPWEVWETERYLIEHRSVGVKTFSVKWERREVRVLDRHTNEEDIFYVTYDPSFTVDDAIAAHLEGPGV